MGWDLLINGVSLGLLYGLIATGYSMIWSTASILHFAHGQFVMLGGFIALSLIRWHGGALANQPVFVLLMVATGVGAFGLFVQRYAYMRIPIENFRTRVITTVGVGQTIQAASSLIWGSRAFTLPDGFFTGSSVKLADTMITPAYYWILGASVIADAGLIYLLYRTKAGLGLRAVAARPDVAELVGVNSTAMYMFAFVLGSAIAGMTGVLIAPITFIRFDLGLAITVKGFASAVIGGLGDFSGAIIGGLLIGLAEAFGGWISPEYKDLMVFVFLLSVIAFKPQGLLGRASVQKV